MQAGEGPGEARATEDAHRRAGPAHRTPWWRGDRRGRAAPRRREGVRARAPRHDAGAARPRRRGRGRAGRAHRGHPRPVPAGGLGPMSSAVSTFPAAVPARPATNKWLVTVSVTFGTLMGAIDASIVNVALPHLRGAVGATRRGDHLGHHRLRHRDRAGDAAHRLPRPALRPEARLHGEPRALRRRLGALRHRAHARAAGASSASSRASAPARCSRPSRRSCARRSRPRSRAWRWRSSAWRS